MGPRRSSLMPRRCTVCLHPHRLEVDKELVANRTFSSIASHYGLSLSALKRHKKTHLPAQLVKAHRAAEVGRAADLVEYRNGLETAEIHQAIDMVQQLKAINAACLEVLKKARAAEKHSVLLSAVDRISRQIEIQARWLNEILRSEEELQRRVDEGTSEMIYLLFESVRIELGDEASRKIAALWLEAFGIKVPPEDPGPGPVYTSVLSAESAADGQG